MTLRCKVGDLAFIRAVAGVPGENFGLVVRCVRYIGLLTFDATGPEPAWDVVSDGRKIKGQLKSGDHIFCRVATIADRVLCPIRDSDAPDEMIEIVGRPAATPRERETEQQ